MKYCPGVSLVRIWIKPLVGKLLVVEYLVVLNRSKAMGGGGTIFDNG